MKHKHFRFHEFLKNNTIYKENKKYWMDFILQLNPDFVTWMTEFFVNGVEIIDGNPLISMISGNQAIRIVQIERDNLKPKFASWFKQYENNGITELIICIQPFEEIYIETQELIPLFIRNRHTARLQNRFNQKYNRILNQKRTKFLIRSYENINSKNYLINANLEVDKNTVNRISTITRKLHPYDSSFGNTRIERPYNQSLEKALSIRQNLKGRKIISSTDARRINNAFNSFKSQLAKLKSEMDKQ